MTLPTPEEVLDRERRWLRPAGITALFGVLLFAAGQVTQQLGVPSADNNADQLTEFHDHTGQILAGQILQGLGLAAFAFPLYVLFKAAEARAERVRGAFVGFCLIGPILLGIATPLVALGLADAADGFVEQAPAVEQEARQKAETPESADDAVDDARDDLADDVVDDSSLLGTARFVQLAGLFSMLIALLYTSLWATRTGLLTRFWGSLGMALGVALILLGPFGLLLTVLWFAVLGFRLAGWSRRGLPPAWAAGVAMPWDPPGGSPPQGGDPDDVEGSGRELEEPPLPEEEPQEDRPPPKKRKRRS